MRRIVGLVEIRQMAANAGGRGVVELSSRMASAAIERCVGARQREAGELQMVKLGAHPVVHGVAVFACDRQGQGDVVDANRLGADEILLMARITGRREALKLADGRALVALVAIECCVRADQWEAVEMLVDLLDRNIPALHRVALLAVCSHLPLVDVGVAIGALRTHIREDGLGMALRAAHAFVHAAQRIFRGVVIELRNSPDGLPPAQGVTVLAGNAEASVRAARRRGRLRLAAGKLPARQNRHSDYEMQ